MAFLGFALIMYGNPLDKVSFVSMGTWIIVLSCMVGFVLNVFESGKKYIQHFLVLLSLILFVLIFLFLTDNFSYISVDFIRILCYNLYINFRR